MANLGQGALASGGSRRALVGFFISGLLLAFLGAILLAWEHHLTSDYGVVGLYFVGLITGMMIAVWASRRLLAKRGIRWTLSFACGLAGVAFLFLAFFSPPWPYLLRVFGMALVGFAAGLLHTAIFTNISPMYRHDPAATVNLAGMLFGLGCLFVTVLIAGVFYMYNAPTMQVWIAIVPALFGWMYWKSPVEHEPELPEEAPHAILQEIRSPAAVLFALVLFFQLGNEWAIAGWLPLFLTQRLGISPATALWMLALYWSALLIGRVVSQAILTQVRHSRLLLTTVACAILGCVILIATDNRFGAISGVLLVGAAFAPIYPLMVEKIGDRFPSYHPGQYNGIFSLAMAGGLLAPCSLGYFASALGLQFVMALPLMGSVVVFFLLLLVWLESRFSLSKR